MSAPPPTAHSPSTPTPPHGSALIVTPAPHGSRAGNRTTALRLAAHLRALGFRPRVADTWQGQPCELLVAVHAVKSADSVLRARTAHPRMRIVVVLAGTDLYPEFAPGPRAIAALDAADALVALQPRALDLLPARWRAKATTIVQSAAAVTAPKANAFRACVLAHLRPVKDPLLPFAALQFVPRDVPIEVVLAGRALSEAAAASAREALANEPRARWLGELPRRSARQLLASSHVCLVPSGAEGGANVVSEAIAAGIPLLATAVPGNLGLLGADWPGCFAPGDARGLGALLRRAATDGAFLTDLQQRTVALQPMVAPAAEREAWRRLLGDLRTAGTAG